MTTYQYAHRRHQGVDSRTRPTDSGSPSSPVTIRQLTEEERAELDERLSNRGRPHKITKEGYLSERAKGKTRAQIADEHDITAAGLAGAINRWGLSDKGDEQRAIREHMGVVLPPGVRVFRPGDPAPSPLLAAQEPARDVIETEEGDCMAEVVKTQGTGTQESAHEVTQAEREEMFGIDTPPHEPGRLACVGRNVRVEQADDLLPVGAQTGAYIMIRVPMPVPGGVTGTPMTAAETRRRVSDSNAGLTKALEHIVNNLHDWTGSASVEQVQAWVDKALGH